MAVARRHRLVLALWLPLLAGAAALQPVLEARLAAPDYTMSGSESSRARGMIGDRFPSLGAEQDVLVLRSRTLTADDPAFRRVVERTLAAVGRRPGVTGVVSPYDELAGGRVSADGHTALALVGLGGDDAARSRLADDLQRAAALEAAGSGVEADLSGYSPLNDDLSAVELRDQETAEAVGVPIALAVLLLALGGLVAAMVPLALAGAAVLVCMGALALLAGPLRFDQFVTVIATMIGVGVGIDYALFVVSRFREELDGRRDREAVVAAVGAALDTSGRTVVASGLVVIIALGSIAVMDGHVFLEIAIAAGSVVAAAVLASLTLLPALLGWLGGRVEAGALPRRLRPPRARAAAAAGWWGRWARLVLRHPVRLGLPALLLLAAAAAPLASIRLGLDLGLAALWDTPSGRGQEAAAAAFGPGAVGPVELVVCATGARLGTADLDAVARLGASLRADPRVAEVAAPTDLLDRVAGGHGAADLAAASARPELRPVLARQVDLDRGGRRALVAAVAAVPVDSPAAARLVADVRARIAPRALAGTGATVAVGGLTAQYADLSTRTAERLPVVVGIVLALSFGYLVVVFRSLLLPAKAVLMNLLATAAALGLTVLVFQDGHGGGLLRFTSVGTVQAYLPVALFALLFGLSMDYEVFLVRRIQEEWWRSGDTAEAVAVAMSRTARQITAAAAIMAAVFGGFLVAGVLELKQFGFGLAVAVLVDATVVRLLVVPAFMRVASRANWWLPAVLARWLPPGPGTVARE
jgi:RND superfamily putative drug exporter